MIIRTGSKAAIATGISSKDAEFSIVGKSNSSLCKFGLKVDDIGEGENRSPVWENCVAWNRIADICKDIKKGDVVFITGKEETSSYTNRDGEPKTKTDFVVEYVSILKTLPREEMPTTVQSSSINITKDEEINLDEDPF
jgi:single-stranded DNA-binding protein